MKPKKMKKDLEQLVKVIEGHPDPYRIIPEDGFNQVVDHIKEQIKEPKTVEEFYKLVSSLVALIKDGHSSLNMPRNWMKNQRKKFGVFPYKIHVSNDDKLFLLKHYAEDMSIRPGTEVLKINNVPIANFIEAIDPWISYEIPRFRNVIIEEQFEQFLVLYFGSSADLNLSFADDTETIVENIPEKKFKDAYKDDREERDNKIRAGKPYDYKKITDEIGILSIYSFSVPDIDKYDAFLRKTFRKINSDSIKSLILDVRGNFGGFPRVSSMLIHHLTNKPFKTMERSDVKISKAYREYFDEQTLGWSLKDFTVQRQSKYHIDIDAVMNNKIGSYKTSIGLFNEEARTLKNEYRGDVYLLTDRVSFSAASSFAAIIKCYELGTIIGDETGGTRIFHANAFGNFLKNSKIIYGMSSTKLYTTCPSSEGEGITPDIPFIPSVLELASGFDSHLNFAKLIIKKINKKKKLQKELGNKP